VKPKLRYALGMIVMPIVFPLCAVWSFILNLKSAAKECAQDTAYDVGRDWDSLCRLYKAAINEFLKKDRS